jgi:hypothetical protein
MPKRNPTRSIAEGDHLAERMVYERDLRDWSNESLARRMTDVGCPINQSALYKLDKVRPRRRITVEELVAFSRVFDLSLDELLIPPALVENREAVRLATQWTNARESLRLADERFDAAKEELRAYLNGHPDVVSAVVGFLADRWSDLEHPDEAAEHTALSLLDAAGTKRYLDEHGERMAQTMTARAKERANGQHQETT